jgi:SPP1 gp7 family putative phage head morphogenesis protein
VPFRHALHIEAEYRARLRRRCRTIAAIDRERHDALDPITSLSLLGVAVAVSRFIGRQIDAHLAKIGHPRPGEATAVVEGARPTIAPPAPEIASYHEWAAWEQRAIAESEALLQLELPVRPDALDRALVRADLIAMRGVTWQTGVTTELRSRAAGVDGYDWDTMDDDKVRPVHRELHGTRQRWDDPPVAEANGDRYHAGQAHGCRCWALPRVIDVEAF